MTVKNMVGTLARTGVSTAVTVVRHPIGSASLAAGLVKGVAEASVDVVRNVITGQPPAPEREASDPVEDATRPATDPAPAAKAAPEPEPEREREPEKVDPRDNIPGPDLAAFEPPRPEDLPEPIVIEAEPEAPGEAFHTEPKAATRDSAHGGVAGDREEADGYREEIVDEDFEIETPVGTPGAEVGTNPDTAESDLQQPGTPPLLERATLRAVESETDILRKAADPGRG